MNSDSSFNDVPVRETIVRTENQKSVLTPILGVGLLAVAAFSIFQYTQMNGLRQELSTRGAETAAVQAQVSALNSSLSGATSDLQAKLADSTQQTTQSIAKMQSIATKHADIVAGKVQKTMEQQDADRQVAVDAELAGVKNAASDAATRIDGVGASVDSVKSDLASTKTAVDKTASDLQRASGDMGLMSGLIATNGKEISELRALGDRNIYEFQINKKAGLQRVGDVQIRVTKTDDKRNRYTMVVMADDKLVEKRDKTTNEPVQFYATQGSRTPYEVVVNEVGKDTIKGYLATPKIATARK